MERAINQRNFWQVLSYICNAAYTRPDLKPALKYLRSINSVKGDPYRGRKLSLTARIRQLPPGIATRFMDAYAQPQVVKSEPLQIPASITDGKSIDALVFEHFEGRFKRWEQRSQ